MGQDEGEGTYEPLPQAVKQFYSKDDFYFGSGSAKFAPSHHMFTAPHPDDVALLGSDPMKVRGLQHDLVLNGLNRRREYQNSSAGNSGESV